MPLPVRLASDDARFRKGYIEWVVKDRGVGQSTEELAEER